MLRGARAALPLCLQHAPDGQPGGGADVLTENRRALGLLARHTAITRRTVDSGGTSVVFSRRADSAIGSDDGGSLDVRNFSGFHLISRVTGGGEEMKKLSIALVLALAALSGVGTVWADDAGSTIQAP